MYLIFIITLGEKNSMIVIVMGSGGHTKRGLEFAKHMDEKISYIIPFEARVTKQKIGQNYFSVISPRFKAKSNIFLTILRTLFTFLHSFCLLLIIRPNVVVTTGSGLSYPVLMMANLLHIKTVYIESPSRVYEPSTTGKLLMGKVDLWLAAWPELAKKYNVKYIGMLR